MRTMLLVLVVVSMFVVGCTQGQLAPTPIKNCVYAAKADAVVTAEKVRADVIAQPASVDFYRDKMDEALRALDRIGGTRSFNYENGLLSPVSLWFKGKKPEGK